MTIFGYDFSTIEIIFSIILLLCFLYQIFFYLYYLNAPIYVYKRENRKVEETDEEINEVKPVLVPVSIIICAKDEFENLSKYLPAVLEQDYPDFEVIVVNDGSTDDTANLLDDLAAQYPNLRTTFVPIDARNLSTKKLGLTLGIKAAKNEWLLFTDADCCPDSDQWLRLMSSNFVEGTEFVLGYSPYLKHDGILNRIISYDTLFNGLQYLGFAYRNMPYMGVGRNLAYRKSTFFNNKGFASRLKLMSGDDDLFVNEFSNSTNTRIEVSPESVCWSNPHTRLIDWFFQKQRHISVSSYYRSETKYRLIVEPLTRALFYSLLLVNLFFANLLTIGFMISLMLIRFATQYFVLRNASNHFKQRQTMFSIPLWDISLPILNLYLLATSNLYRSQRNLKWK